MPNLLFKTQRSQSFSGPLSPRASRLARGEQGFTLVELMIVVTIAGILITLAEPSFRNSVVNAREAVLKQDLFTMRDAIDQFRSDRAFPSDSGQR